MANLQYAVEYLFDDSSPNNPSAFLQFKQSPKKAVWIDRIRKQDYAGGNSLADAAFAVAGVTEISIQPYRIWFSRSPIYSWEEIIFPLLATVVSHLSLDGYEEIPGYPMTLDSVNNRLEP